MMADEIVLSYHDSLLKNSDVALLEEGQWISDVLIGFFYEYLSNEVCKDKGAGIGLVSPEVVQFVKFASVDDVNEFLQPLELKQKEIVLFPINSNSSVMAGGMHWSLMAYVKSRQEFFHLDSLTGNNGDAAKSVTRKVGKHLSGASNVTEVHCPQQTNSYDCGMYVICFSELICQMYVRGEDFTTSNLHVAPQMVTSKRKALKSLILNLGDE